MCLLILSLTVNLSMYVGRGSVSLSAFLCHSDSPCECLSVCLSLSEWYSFCVSWRGFPIRKLLSHAVVSQYGDRERDGVRYEALFVVNGT